MSKVKNCDICGKIYQLAPTYININGQKYFSYPKRIKCKLDDGGKTYYQEEHDICHKCSYYLDEILYSTSSEKKQPILKKFKRLIKESEKK